MKDKEFLLSKRAKNKLQYKDRLKKKLIAGTTAQSLIGFNDETMAKFTFVAYHFCEAKLYEDAANCYLFLVTLNPNQHDYWIGLGISMQHCGQYEAAIDAYEMAAVCKIDDPNAYFCLAKCLFAIHDRENSINALNLALEYTEEKDEHKDLRKQILAAKDLLFNFN